MSKRTSVDEREIAMLVRKLGQVTMLEEMTRRDPMALHSGLAATGVRLAGCRMQAQNAE
jgi:hypothetical protein